MQQRQLLAGEYVGDAGFTLVALLDDFVMISAFDLGAPMSLVLVLGALRVSSESWACSR